MDHSTQIEVSAVENADYKPSVVAAASGITLVQLRNWERSDRSLVQRDGNRWFSFRRALQVGIAAELLKLGVRAEFAIAAASTFTDMGRGPLGSTPARYPGQLFDEGWTILCIYAGGNYDVKQMAPNASVSELFQPFGMTRADFVTALNLTFFVERFRLRLDEVKHGGAAARRAAG